MLTATRWFLYFIIYSFIGWVVEVCYCFAGEKKFVNRGFLIGPICPIYGYGVLFIVLLVHGDKSDILAIFLKSILICSILEYYTSYFMEKLFHARWWDYSGRKYNINGRICLETMIPFGLLGSGVVLFVHPLIQKIVLSFSNNTTYIIGGVVLFLFLVDNAISFGVLSKIKNEITNQKVDSTETIRKKVMKWLDNNSFLFKHIKNAFPEFRIRGKKRK